MTPSPRPVLLAPRRSIAARDAASVHLPAGTAIAHVLPAGACVAVQSGRVWLTRSGDPVDHFVGAGERHVLVRAARVVLEADGAGATLRIGRAGAGDVPTRSAPRPGFP